jgi:hypothetical protein
VEVDAHNRNVVDCSLGGFTAILASNHGVIFDSYKSGEVPGSCMILHELQIADQWIFAFRSSLVINIKSIIDLYIPRGRRISTYGY